MHTSSVTYDLNGTLCKGFLAYKEEDPQQRPAVVLFHAWRGQDSFVRDKALELAKMGYVAFAADLYGEGINASSDDEALQLMLPLFRDRHLLQDRVRGAVEQVRSYDFVDNKRTGAIGFCFGGLAVLELIRSGMDVLCGVSFHGLLADVLGDVRAKRPVNAPSLSGSILFLHGHEDPMVSPTDITTVEEELDEAEVDWTFVTFSHTLHAFTNPSANDPEKGTAFKQRSATRSWKMMENYLEEHLKEN